VNNKYIIRKPGLLDNVVVHEHLVRDHNATGAILLSNIYFLGTKNETCTQSIKSMSFRTGISRNTIRRYLKKFVSLKLIEKITVNEKAQYKIGDDADNLVVAAYKEMLAKGKKSGETGSLVKIELKNIKLSKGKEAEKSRFIAFVTSFCVDKFASSMLRTESINAYFEIPSINKLAKRFGVTRQTLSKIIRTLKSKNVLRVERFEGSVIIDFMFGLKERILQKRALLAKTIFT
jgi:DNA-binding transcriptional regulator YhcF (GntR family)